MPSSDKWNFRHLLIRRSYRLGASGKRGKILIEPAELDKLYEARKVTGGGASTEPLRHIATPRNA